MNVHTLICSRVSAASASHLRPRDSEPAFCEIDKYAQQVLCKNFGAVLADADDNEPSQDVGTTRIGKAESGEVSKEADFVEK